MGGYSHKARRANFIMSKAKLSPFSTGYFHRNGGDISMSQTAEHNIRAVTAVKNDTKTLVRYAMQLAMLNRLLSHKLMTEKEYHKINEQLKKDYGIASAF